MKPSQGEKERSIRLRAIRDMATGKIEPYEGWPGCLEEEDVGMPLREGGV